jgi:hypothetical protein
MRDWNSDGIIVGRPLQNVNEQSETQKYPIGMIYEAFGKRWRYCRAYEAITPGKRGCPNMAPSSWTAGVMSMGSDSTTVTGTKGDSKVLIFTGGDYDLPHAVDYFQGGILTVFPAAGIAIHQYRIIGNDLSFTSDTYMWIYIDPPLAATEASTPCDVMSSPYKNVGAPASVGTGRSVVVVPEILVTSGYFFWGQTRGPCWVTPNAEWKTASTREAEWHTNGTIKAAAGVALQRAGYQLHDTASDEDAYIMLMLE